MKTSRSASEANWLGIAAVIGSLYATAITFRPALPVDETRYLTVAWEMLLRHDWLAPLTVNFEAYHHKPPFLFWMIQTSWGIFGVSRWAAVIPVVLASFSSVVMTTLLCRRLLPELERRTQLIMLGSTAFLLYATAILFDLTVTVFVLAALTCTISYSKDRRYRFMIVMGLFLGLGVLTKGPVAYLYVLFPVVLARYWMSEPDTGRNWYRGHLLALGVSLLPVLLWLVPVLRATDSNFGYWLVWEQTAGRVTGSYASSHARPVYFYLLVLPVLLLPWTLFPSFWRGTAEIRRNLREQPGIRFLVAWLVPTFLVFSLIGGKQPHYMVPLLPGLAMLIATMTASIPFRRIQLSTAVMLVAFVAAHIVLAGPFISRYDLSPMASFIAEQEDRDIAFAGAHYRGEFNFLARRTAPVDTTNIDELPGWFDAHPEGMAVVRYREPGEIADYDILMHRPYRGKQMAIISPRSVESSPLARETPFPSSR